jgi:L,D-transpeptidase ErfK/SrfK
MPVEESDSIEINVLQRMLIHFEGKELRGAYPVAVGQPGKQWQTPIGSLVVIRMRKDPLGACHGRFSAKKEAEGKEVVNEIEPGSNNPLGKYWIGLSAPMIGIHGTNHPSSVYSDRSHGCMRLRPDDIEALFQGRRSERSGRCHLYAPARGKPDNGRIFLESGKDIYHKGTGGIAAVRDLAPQANGIETELTSRARGSGKLRRRNRW